MWGFFFSRFGAFRHCSSCVASLSLSLSVDFDVVRGARQVFLNFCQLVLSARARAPRERCRRATLLYLCSERSQVSVKCCEDHLVTGKTGRREAAGGGGSHGNMKQRAPYKGVAVGEEVMLLASV